MQRAIQIARFIYETENKKKTSENMECREPGGHAGRLLINHGYLKDAIKTKSKTFLHHKTVIHILNKIWFGEDECNFRKVFV